MVPIVLLLQLRYGYYTRLQAESISPVKHHSADDGPVLSVISPALYVEWLFSVTPKTSSNVERDQRRYCGTIGYDVSHPADVPADAKKYVDVIFAQGTVWQGECGSSFTDDKRSDTATALARISKTVLAS